MACPFCGDEHPAGTYVCPATQRRLTGILTDGAIVDGKYRIMGVIGTGGMAAVYRAEHTKIGRQVALKMLLPEYVQYPELTARVEREARAAGSIDHPNVVAIVDLGSTAEYGPYIAMELLKGDELATHMERSGGTLPPLEAAEITRQVLGALEAAHHKGVVHRDLKPENVFLARVDDDRMMVKVLDFGISKVGPEQGNLTSLTRTGTVMGTPQFMAPEQAAGAKQQDARVDIYACGAVLYAMLSNALPYHAENYNLLINEILNRPPIPITERVRDLDPTLAGIVMKAIARKADQRYPNARAMQDAIVAWMDSVMPPREDRSSVGLRPSEPGGGEPGEGRSSRTPRPAIGRLPTPAPMSVRGRPTPPVELRRAVAPSVEATEVSLADMTEMPAASPPVRAPTPAPVVASPAPAAVAAVAGAARSAGTLPAVAAAAHDAGRAAARSLAEIDPLAPSTVTSSRANTRTPLGWENTPDQVVLPRPRKNRGIVLSVLALGALASAAFGVRALRPEMWNRAMRDVGLHEYTVPLAERPVSVPAAAPPAAPSGDDRAGATTAGPSTTATTTGSSPAESHSGTATTPTPATSSAPTPRPSTTHRARTRRTPRRRAGAR